MSESVTAADVAAAIAAEYGTYVATTPIDIDGARAFNAGDPVPVSHVDRGVVPVGQVRKIAKAASATEKKG